MSGLFTFESLSLLNEPSPDKLLVGDARWGLEFIRRKVDLESDRSETDPCWLLAAAGFTHDTAEYELSLAYGERAIAASSSGPTSLLARALLFQCMNFLAVADGSNADCCVHELEKLTSDSQDACAKAICALAKGMNWQYNVSYMEQRQVEKGASLAKPLFEEAIVGLSEVCEVDLAIRAQLELGRAQFELGQFFAGISAIEEATQMARNSQCWNQIGRMILLFASNASDMGYRVGVEDVIRRALEWCDFLGDAWGRVEALTVLGRFLYYEMPPSQPQMAIEADQYLQSAAREAESLGVSRLKASIDSTLFFLYRKAGDDRKLMDLLGADLADEEFRKKQSLDNMREIEKIAEDRRRNTAMRLHDGIQDSQDAFFVFDAFRDSEGRCRDFRWAYANRAGTKIFEELSSQVYLFSEARKVPHFANLESALLHAVDDRQSYEDSLGVESDHGSIWLQRRVVPSGDGAVVNLRDVTAERRIETALREAAESARQSESAKSAFLASMSHEIRTPLNGVLGLTRMLAETELNPLQRAYIENIVLSGDILLALIGDVLDLSKIEAREMQLVPSPISLKEIVASVANLFQGQTQEKKIGLHFVIESSVPETVLADAVRLRQILSNLVGNAVKFTEKGSVEIRVYSDDLAVVFEIQDSGIGIAPEQIEPIFSRFKQARGSTFGGTGLGLTITRALAELMGGEVSVVSEVGHGSTFTVRLPFQAIATQPSHLPKVPVKGFHGRRVLVVDDNKINLLVSSHAIEKFGCETLCAGDGLEALAILERENFDMVFLDIQMPFVNGLEVTRELRRRESETSRTRVVALTAGALLQEQQACFDAGMDDYITKPITLDSIQEVLTKWLHTDPI